MTDLDISESHGTCHCGAVRFRVRLSDGLRSARRCTCSYCRMRGAIAVSAGLDDIEILQGADMLSHYRFGTMTAHHFFVQTAVSIPIISAARIPANMALTSPASTE